MGRAIQQPRRRLSTSAFLPAHPVAILSMLQQPMEAN